MIRLLGVDPLSDDQLRPFDPVSSNSDADTFRAFFTEANTVVLADELAAALHAQVGSNVRVNTGDRIQSVRVVGIAKMTGPFRSQLGDLMIADLATAQELARCVGKIDRVDLQLPAGATTRCAGCCRPVLSFIQFRTARRSSSR